MQNQLDFRVKVIATETTAQYFDDFDEEEVVSELGFLPRDTNASKTDAIRSFLTTNVTEEKQTMSYLLQHMQKTADALDMQRKRWSEIRVKLILLTPTLSHYFFAFTYRSFRRQNLYFNDLSPLGAWRKRWLECSIAGITCFCAGIFMLKNSRVNGSSNLQNWYNEATEYGVEWIMNHSVVPLRCIERVGVGSIQS